MPDCSDKAAYDDLPDGVLVADADGRVVALNPAAERLLGTTADAALGRDYREVLPLADEQGRDWWACTDPYGGLPSRTRQPERSAGRSTAASDLLVTASYVRDADRRLVRLVVCAARHRAPASGIERSRANLVSTVAHELRSPLTSVKGFTATLLAKWDRFNDDQKKVMLQTVNADADRVTRLITELLDVSRIDAGRLEMRKQVVDLPAAVRKTVAGRVAAGEPESRFAVRRARRAARDVGRPRQVPAGRRQPRRERPAARRGHRHGDGRSATRRRRGRHRRRRGRGHPEDDRASRVFTRFWRGGDRRGGTGLGLYIVKGLVEAHGGSVVGRSGAERRRASSDSCCPPARPASV